MTSGTHAPGGRAVVITGASSGLGEHCALHLARQGFRVFAGVRREVDGKRLADAAPEGTLTPVHLDVTDEESIAAATRTVAKTLAGRGLWALVNNAGIVVPSPLAWLRPARFREQLETGLVGQLAVVQAFLPQLTGSNGTGSRIVNVTSGLGTIGVPFLGAYVASQFGKEGLSDVLRRELAPLGVHVSVVRTGAIMTPMWDKAAGDGDRAADEADGAFADTYKEPFLGFLAANERLARASKTTPADFARTVAKVLTVPRPKPRYAVGKDAAMAAVVARLLPAALLDRQFRVSVR